MYTHSTAAKAECQENKKYQGKCLVRRGSEGGPEGAAGGSLRRGGCEVVRRAESTPGIYSLPVCDWLPLP
eukprot:175773-Prorocentrum_minimum.AAC.1